MAHTYHASHPSGQSLNVQISNPFVTLLDLNKTKSGLVDFGGNSHASLSSLRYVSSQYYYVAGTIEAPTMMPVLSAPFPP